MESFDESFDVVSEHLRAAVMLLGRWKIPPTPMMYEVAYWYVASRSERICDEINGRIASGVMPDAEFLASVHARFLRSEKAAIERGIGHLTETVETLEQDLDDGCQAMTRLNEFARKQSSSSVTPEELIGRLVAENRRLMRKVKEAERRAHRISEDLHAVRRQSKTDFLTGLNNRRAFDLKIDGFDTHDMRQAQAYVFMFDLDRFKRINDTYGHIMGDKFLKVFSEVMKTVAIEYGISEDDLFRYGGEEMACVTCLEADRTALDFSERVRVRFSGTFLTHRGQKCFTTVSIGVAKRRPQEAMRDVIERADRCLYQAKREGRNRVVFEGKHVCRQHPMAMSS